MNITSKIVIAIVSICLVFSNISCLQGNTGTVDSLVQQSSGLQVGAERIPKYLPIIKDKTIAVVANQTSLVGTRHLVDTLLSLGVSIKCVFAPEHGFRGEAGAGDKIQDSKDLQTGLSIVSLYGKHMKPTADDLKGVEVVIFDIQDVGVRFYTYISTLQYVMEACIENSVALIILDRPNPNGFYVDGPVLDESFRSFVGMQKIPVVHGMTIGEYSKMLIGESWIERPEKLNLHIVEVANYSHKDKYQLPIRPSPNLPNMQSVYLYPSLCFFEGAAVSIGRGTDFPFQCYGFPGMDGADFKFKPVAIPGVATNPPYKDTVCSGIDLRKAVTGPSNLPAKLRLDFLISAYSLFPDKNKFFNPFFEKLSGTNELRYQIINSESEEMIRKSWEPELSAFKKIRKKHLLYEDFE
ncbi:MAG TPA: DUF1343 domain-containing protein [Bacteroidia bacterium]|nr:DUF1343 domain-containing protein [Bacteroidia bacterium]HNS12612.1 DUF1343 domain-containing protein [Bacteroidia bacterium]